jgi:phosphoribosylglycinamide formyltransferase 1
MLQSGTVLKHKYSCLRTVPDRFFKPRGLKMKIAVLCSGKGSNFKAIIDAAKQGLFKAEIAVMICDNPEAYAVAIARQENIPCLVLSGKDFSSKQGLEEAILNELRTRDINLICLAGYMRLLSPEFIKAYKDRILNIHPSLLPAFKGASGIEDAFEYGVKVTGVTVHFVTDEVDAGPIILQKTVEVHAEDTKESLRENIHRAEHILYPEAIRLFTEGRLKIDARQVIIT